MSAADASRGPKAAGSLQVDAATAAGKISMRECVRHAVSDYFRSLDGEPCVGLYDKVIRQVEAPLFEVVMRESAGNCTRAAEALGISRATLRSRLKRYNLDQ